MFLSYLLPYSYTFRFLFFSHFFCPYFLADLPSERGITYIVLSFLQYMSHIFFRLFVYVIFSHKLFTLRCGCIPSWTYSLSQSLSLESFRLFYVLVTFLFYPSRFFILYSPNVGRKEIDFRQTCSYRNLCIIYDVKDTMTGLSSLIWQLRLIIMGSMCLPASIYMQPSQVSKLYCILFLLCQT